MSDNHELETLLKNIQQGLKRYSVNELNEAIVKAIGDKNTKSDEIKYVLTIVCNEFDITEFALINSKKRGNLQDAKQIAYCLLYFNIGLSIREIADEIFFNWHTSVAIGINKFKKSDFQHKQDKVFLEKYDKLRTKLMNFIEQQKTKVA